MSAKNLAGLRPPVDLLKNVPLLVVGRLECLQRAGAQEVVGRRRQGRLHDVQNLQAEQTAHGRVKGTVSRDGFGF